MSIFRKRESRSGFRTMGLYVLLLVTVIGAKAQTRSIPAFVAAPPQPEASWLALETNSCRSSTKAWMPSRK